MNLLISRFGDGWWKIKVLHMVMGGSVKCIMSTFHHPFQWLMRAAEWWRRLWKRQKHVNPSHYECCCEWRQGERHQSLQFSKWVSLSVDCCCCWPGLGLMNVKGRHSNKDDVSAAKKALFLPPLDFFTLEIIAFSSNGWMEEIRW